MSPPTPSIRLRRATVADAAQWSTLASRLFEQTFAEANTPQDMQDYLAYTFTTAKQTEELGSPDRVVLFAEDESGTVVGYASVLRASPMECAAGSHPAEVERIYVDRPLHGRRIGDVLMDACVDQAKAWGCDVLWLAVWEKNPRAIAFYERRGFARVGAKTFQLGADLQRDFVMARSLA